MFHTAAPPWKRAIGPDYLGTATLPQPSARAHRQLLEENP